MFWFWIINFKVLCFCNITRVVLSCLILPNLRCLFRWTHLHVQCLLSPLPQFLTVPIIRGIKTISSTSRIVDELCSKLDNKSLLSKCHDFNRYVTIDDILPLLFYLISKLGTKVTMMATKQLDSWHHLFIRRKKGCTESIPSFFLTESATGYDTDTCFF